MLTLILIILLIMLLIGGLPNWPYARNYNYGYYPSGIIFVILIVVLIFYLLPGGIR